MTDRFFAMGLSDRLIAFSDPDNVASHRVLTKTGMRQIETRPVGGVDAVVFRIDATKWKAL